MPGVVFLIVVPTANFERELYYGKYLRGDGFDNNSKTKQQKQQLMRSIKYFYVHFIEIKFEKCVKLNTVRMYFNLLKKCLLYEVYF